MNFKKMLALTLSTSMLGASMVGCAPGSTDTPTTTPTQTAATSAEPGAADPASLSGEITFITHRTDLVDNLYQEYITKFNAIYPNVEIKIEGLTDYEGDITTRMNTVEYGDVLMIPNINKNEYPNFFEPLGTVEELSKTYRNMNDRSFEGNVYGIATMLTAPGVLYNKKVFENAGITEIPATEEEFLAAMQKIKDKGEAIPYYTNYAAQWTLTQWEASRLAFGDPNYVNELANMDAPFAEGTAHYEIYKVLYDLVKQGLVEEDPMTTDWETSKQMMADGEIGAMVLGQWAVSQVKALAENPDDIGYMPFPINAPDGKKYAEIASDYALAVNKNSKNKEAALAFLWWLVNESGYAESQDAIPAQKDAPLPDTLASFENLGVTFITAVPAEAGKEDLVDTIDNTSEVGLWQPTYKLRIVEAAMGNRDETYDDIMADLNAAWAEARAEVVAK